MLDAILQAVTRAVCRAVMRLEVRGVDNLDKAGPRAVIVPNHVGFLDPPLLASVLGKVVFAIDRTIAGLGWVKPFMRFHTTFVIDPEKPMATRQLIDAVRAGARVVIFPEGRLTVTGRIMKVYDGAAFVADRADAALIPVHIGGMETSFFNRMPGELARRRLRPPVTVTIGAPERLDLAGAGSGKTRREAATAQMRAILVRHQMFASIPPGTISDALAATGRAQGARRQVLEERLFERCSYRGLTGDAARAGDRLSGLAAAGEGVAVMLPNTIAGVTAILGLIGRGRVPYLVDGSDGAAITRALAASGCRVLLTDTGYVDREKLGDPARLLPDGKVVLLDEAATLPQMGGRPSATADAGGVALALAADGNTWARHTHRAILANLTQIRTAVDLGRSDRYFACLPLSHPLGLVASILLPLTTGGTVYLHDWPRQPRMLAEYIYLAKPTVLFMPATLLAAIGEAAKPEDLRSLRYLFASDGPVARDVRDLFIDRFGLRILDLLIRPETLAVAMNTPAAARTGTLGALLPGISADPAAAGDAGLTLRGPNLGEHGVRLNVRLENGFVHNGGATATVAEPLKLLGGGDQAA